jgi:putative ABC transport system permease protein
MSKLGIPHSLQPSAFRMQHFLSSAWNTIFRKAALERDLDDELRATIDTLADRFILEGMSRAAAERAALEALGGSRGLMQVREEVREARIGAAFESLLLDARYAWRALRNTRGVTAVITLTLALGIGANTAIFSIVHSLLLQPLPYRDADRLAFIWLDRSDVGYPRGPLSAPDVRDLREHTTAFAAIGAIWASGTVALTDHGAAQELRSASVTTNFFQVLGAEAALGRTFDARDAASDAEPAIVIGWDLFEQRFGADPAIVGRRILVSDHPTTVIGVMPRTFRLLLPQDSSVPDRLQVWQPFWHGVDESPRGHLFMRVVGRMRPGLSLAEAGADVDAVARSIGQRTGSARAFTTVSLQADAVRDLRGAMFALLAGVAILLTIACVNVASLLIARATARARETALRIALGASRLRLLRQSLLEGLILTLGGAVAGVAAGFAMLRVLIALAPASLARISTARIDGTVLVVTLGVSLVWGLWLSLAPATELFRASSSAKSMRVRSTLVVVQVALSLTLLIAAGLLARGFTELQRVDPGFRAEGRVTVKVALPESRYQTLGMAVDAMRELQQRLAAIPGVRHAGAMSHLPFDDAPNWYLTYGLERSWTDTGVAKADTRAVTPGTLETLGVSLADGRFFSDADGVGPLKVMPVIVDEMVARDLWPGQRAVGQRFYLGQGTPEGAAMVVGVIRHLRIRSLVEELTPQIFVPYASWLRTPMAFVLATDEPPATLVPKVQAVVAGIDAKLPVFDARPLAEYLSAARSARRFTMLLTGTFAVSALLLTCLGVYGVLAYAIATRRHEIGVRRALGADAAHVIGRVLREGMGFAALGSIAGLVAAVPFSRVIADQLYAVAPLDPMTYVCSVVAVFSGAAFACLIPALRASSINPIDVIRNP